MSSPTPSTHSTTWVTSGSSGSRATPFVFNDFVQPVTLPSQGTEYFGSTLLAGWGSHLLNADVTLRKAVVPMISDEECQERYQLSIRMGEETVCAAEPEGGAGACLGDLGSPMMCDFEENPFLCGIGVKVDGCGAKKYPSIYLEVAHYIDWIQQHAYE